MNNDQNSSARYAFPLVTAVVLFLTFAILLTVLLNEANLVNRAQSQYPLPTPYVAPEVAVQPTQAPADATDDAGETPLVEVTVAPDVADENANVDVAPVDDGGTGVVLDPAMIAAGETAFSTVCTACHGMGAQGVPGLGPNLFTSEFVNSLTDDDLAHFIMTGRDTSDPANTTGIPMPARGGNPALTDEQIDMIVVYLRSLAAEAGITPVHAGMDSGATVETAPEVAAAPAPTRDPNIVREPWTAPVPVSDTFVAVDDMPEDAQRLYRWASEGNVADAPVDPALFDASLLERGNEAALIDFLVNETGYLDAERYPIPAFGSQSLPAPQGE